MTDIPLVVTTVRVHRQELDRVIRGALDAREWARQLSISDEVAASVPNGQELPARLERAREFWNATTLIMIFGAIEGHIEAMSRALYPLIEQSNREKRDDAGRRNRTLNARMRADGRGSPGAFKTFDRIDQAIRDVHLKPARRKIPAGTATERWEDVLYRIYLRPTPERPIPDDLRETLDEFGGVRNVLVHGLGHMDEEALGLVVEGPWSAVDDLVVIDDKLYKRYVAGLLSYTFEMVNRVNALNGDEPTFDLSRWRTAVPVGTDETPPHSS